MNSDFMISPTFYIHNIPIYGDTILSPMEGYSDQPYRRLCRQMGSAMSYSEFINARDILEGCPYISRKFTYNLDERPVVFQIYGDNAIALLEVALRLQEYGPDIIDINIGCPSRAVSGHGAGAGLLRTPVKIARIVRKLSRALSVPLTAKMRLGWDDASRDYLLLARIIEENGGAMIAVHGRTKRQGYTGAVDLDAIAEIRQALSIPVVANGDIQTVADIDHMLTHTGCPAVMIGRGAIGNPWIFAHQDREQISPQQVQEIMLHHLSAMLDFYGPEGLIYFRKHTSRYLAPYELPAELRLRLLTRENVGEFVALLEETLKA